VTDAYAELEAEGLVYSQPGSGTFVAPPLVTLPEGTDNPVSGGDWPLWQQELLSRTWMSTNRAFAQIARAAQEEGVHLIGLSVLSGSHMELVSDLRDELTRLGAGDLPIVIGGIIPEQDAAALRAAGVQAVFTPKDHDMNAIMMAMVDIIRRSNGLEARS